MPPALFPSLLSPSSFRPCLMPSPWLQHFVPATSSPVTTAAPICPFSLCLALRPSQRPCYTQRPPRLSAHSSCVLFTQMGGKKHMKAGFVWKCCFSQLSCLCQLLFVLWQDYWIVYRFTCLLSISSVYSTCSFIIQEYWGEMVCVCVWASCSITCFN